MNKILNCPKIPKEQIKGKHWCGYKIETKRKMNYEMANCQDENEQIVNIKWTEKRIPKYHERIKKEDKLMWTE